VVVILSSCQTSEVGLSEAVEDEATSIEVKSAKLSQDLLNEMRVAASQNSTQDTSTDIASGSSTHDIFPC